MTPDQIRNLRPGPELDRAVHATLFSAPLPHPRSGLVIVDPAYSTTWPGLGLVVEEMERRGWFFSGSHGPGICSSAAFARIGSVEADIKWTQTSSDSLFEVACMAALLALAAERAGRGEG